MNESAAGCPGQFPSGLTFLCGSSYDSSGTNAAGRSSRCWNGGFEPESGSFASTESKPSDVTL
jgi:hypothetical protein